MISEEIEHRIREMLRANQMGPATLLVAQVPVLMHWTNLPQAWVPTEVLTWPVPPCVPMTL